MNADWKWASIDVSRLDLDHLNQSTLGIIAVMRVLDGIIDEDGAPDKEIGDWVGAFTVGGLHAAVSQLAWSLNHGIHLLNKRAEKAAQGAKE